MEHNKYKPVNNYDDNNEDGDEIMFCIDFYDALGYIPLKRAVIETKGTFTLYKH